MSLRATVVLLLLLTPLSGLAGEPIGEPFGEPFQLRDQCPPGFELTAEGVCELRTLYQFYDSLQDRGVGGTRTSLPEYRDGFTPQQIDLGRYLFFDPVLSGDGSISCASCHHPDKGFSDDRPRSIGIGGQEVARAAPTLWNVAFLKRLFWDARAESLEEQAEGPLYSSDEMGNTRARLQATLNDSPVYRDLFAQAWPGTDAVQLPQVYTALAAFQAGELEKAGRLFHDCAEKFPEDPACSMYLEAIGQGETSGVLVMTGK